MPAVSKAQQKAAGTAMMMKMGKTKMNKGSAGQMAKSMSMMQLKEFAGTKTKGLPKKVKKAKKGKGRKTSFKRKGKKIYG